MRKRFIAVIVTVMLAFCCFAGGLIHIYAPSDESEQPVHSSTELQLLRTDLKFTQDDQLSRIKAEYLLKNGGYRADDNVVAIVALKDEPILDTYNNSDAANKMSLTKYLSTYDGAAQKRSITRKQNALIDTLQQKGLVSRVGSRYSAIMNGIAVTTRYGNIEKIEALDGVDAVILSDTFNMPKTASVGARDASSASSVENVVDVYETGIFNSGSVSYTGKNTAVAVLDSGFDCSHTVFDHALADDELWLTKDDVTATLPDTEAAKHTDGLKLTDVWYSNKIPFTYDYADKDYDVFPYDSEHGTHVAGIIGGKDDVITGVAVDTQLVLMKVFPDTKSGAETEDILAALEDAILLEVDCINMSLGTSCGFVREYDNDYMNSVYDRIYEKGISLLTAASNDYSSAYGGEQGNTNKVTNPDSATVGAPSTFPAGMSVASISGVKSRYLVCNGSKVVFYRESSSITGDLNDFVAEIADSIGLGSGETRTLEYVTVPGYGTRVNYNGLDVRGKVALVRRGDNTFEDKALRAKNAGAVACIIYNNIEGEIQMSMGKTDHIPTVSITKEVGVELAARSTGTIEISLSYQAGPFMSDFSSWGPTPDLGLKPEITAHGGEIKSAVPGGGYDNMSGTSMATPNLCGIVVLIRQFIKEKFPTYTHKQVAVLANSLMMSTATIVRNEEGNPYSPRKQGAGLASLKNVVNTKAYLSVDDEDRAKLELGDDPKRTGVYDMDFNIVNMSGEALSYDLSMVALTETVSTSDTEFVAEKSHVLGGSYTFSVDNVTANGNTINVPANGTTKVKLKYTLDAQDKAYIDSLFPYGMYVEGFVKLRQLSDNGVDLSIPFLAFYGDWTEAPLFDKTYYEVESQAHDESIDDEDKIKADYYASTPYGSYFYNYIIPLGSYLYDMPAGYDYIPSSEEHIAISEDLGSLDGLSAIYGGMLRNAKYVKYTITDKLTGELIKEYTDYNAFKAHANNGTPVPYYDYLNWHASDLDFINNRQYEFKMFAALDYGDGGLTTNMRNTFSFDFTFDNESPVITSCEYEKVYDSTRRKDRYYLTLYVYDNHYAMSITPIIFNSSSSYTTLGSPLPLYSEKGKENRIRIEITDYLEEIMHDQIITSSLAFMVDDYALNSNIFICQLPGTRGDFKFTKNGEVDGTELTILSLYEDEVIDLTDYLSTKDDTVDADKDYLKYLIWESSDTSIVDVKEGQVRGIKSGRAIVTVTEQMLLKRARLIINVREREADASAQVASANAASGSGLSASKAPLNTKNDEANVNDATLTKLRFSYFETKFAYSRAAQTSDIGQTGARMFLSSTGNSVAFYPGEKIQLFYEIEPWYVADRYEKTKVFSSSNDEVAIVDQDGVVTALKEGTATITMRVDGTNQIASFSVTVKNEFIIENRMLVAYKGLGGKVVIPDDEGIMYIGSYAFCLYDTDQNVILTEEDYDANKIPNANTSVTEVVIPDGVEEIQKYAFYNCSGLQKVTILGEVKFIREYAFYNDVKLAEINLEKVLGIGEKSFYGCEKLNNIDVTKTYAMGVEAFANCKSLETIDITALRNAGRGVFRGCEKLSTVVMDGQGRTKLAESMFAESGLVDVTITEKIQIPDSCFARCKDLEKVTITENLVSIGNLAFCECPLLSDFTMQNVGTIGEQAFYDCESLTAFTLPDCDVSIGRYAFLDCENLASITLQANTDIINIDGSILRRTEDVTGTPKAIEFTVAANNNNYSVSADKLLLLDKSGETIILASPELSGVYTIAASYKKIGNGAFGGTKITELTVAGTNVEIGEYAFDSCMLLEKVTFPSSLPTDGSIKIGNRAFNNTQSLETVVNLEVVKTIGNYAFANSGITEVTVGDGADCGEGAFFRSAIVTANLGRGAVFGMGAFQNCKSLTTVNMDYDIHFGASCFTGDTKLETIDLSKYSARIEDETFYGCTSLTKAELTNVTHIGRYAFSDCSALVTLSMPKVKVIGEGAFARYENSGRAPVITKVTLPATLEQLDEGVFYGCMSLTQVEILSNLEKIENYMFGYCEALKTVKLPDTVKEIGTFAFAGDMSLTEINLGKVETFGDYAFLSNRSLGTADLTSAKTVGLAAFADNLVLSGAIKADNLVKVGDYAFQHAMIRSFSAPKLDEIGIGAFQYNELLTEFVLSSTVKSIGKIAFNGCSDLRSFYYYDDAGAMKNDGDINDYALLDEGVLYIKLGGGDYMLSSVPANKNVETLTVRDRTTIIDFYAGNDNKNVVYVVLPGTVRSIGNYAFCGYDSLKSVEFRSVVAPTLESDYIEGAELDETDPGYDLLHNQFDLFGAELYYHTFVDMVGKRQPIAMILPANEKLTGYDTLVFTAYFGGMSKALRSEYVAMDANMAQFINYAKEIMRIETVTMGDERLVDNALTALEGTKSVATDYGYTEEEWNSYVNAVRSAKATIKKLKGEPPDDPTPPDKPKEDDAPEGVSDSVRIALTVVLAVVLAAEIALVALAVVHVVKKRKNNGDKAAS